MVEILFQCQNLTKIINDSQNMMVKKIKFDTY